MTGLPFMTGLSLMTEMSFMTEMSLMTEMSFMTEMSLMTEMSFMTKCSFMTKLSFMTGLSFLFLLKNLLKNRSRICSRIAQEFAQESLKNSLKNRSRIGQELVKNRSRIGQESVKNPRKSPPRRQGGLYFFPLLLLKCRFPVATLPGSRPGICGWPDRGPGRWRRLVWLSVLGDRQAPIPLGYRGWTRWLVLFLLFSLFDCELG